MEQFIFFVMILFSCNAIINILVITKIKKKELLFHIVETIAYIFMVLWAYRVLT